MPVKIALQELDSGPVRLRGTLPVCELELGSLDEIILEVLPLEFDLLARMGAETVELRGRLAMSLRVECVRCLKPVLWPVELDPWEAVLPLSGPEAVVLEGDSVDLTPILREDMLIGFPQHPWCGSECRGLVNAPAMKDRTAIGPANSAGVPSAWAALDRMKFDNE
jgi:uncharacterized metal-binding protein YceD (DUF177 family)